MQRDLSFFKKDIDLYRYLKANDNKVFYQYMFKKVSNSIKHMLTFKRNNNMPKVIKKASHVISKSQ